MSVSKLEALFDSYHEEGYAPVPTALLDWAIAEIGDLQSAVGEAEDKLDAEILSVEEADNLMLVEADNALSAYCYELLGTHNPTPLDLRDHPALQRLLDAVR